MNERALGRGDRREGDGAASAGASDEALMLRYQRGHREAFAELVRRYEVRVYNFVLRQLGSALAADELAQRVFLGVVVETSRFNYETPFATRLFAIACRLCERERRRAPARRELRGDGDFASRPRQGAPASDEGPSSSVEPLATRGRSVGEALEHAVDQLPDDEKDVFLLREVADISFRDIALVTRQSESAVKIHMQHALSRLRLALQDFDQYRRALASSGGRSHA